MLLLLFESGNREDVNGNGLASHRQCRVYPALGWAGGESAPHWGGHWECGSDWGGQAGFWLGLGGASTRAAHIGWGTQSGADVSRIGSGRRVSRFGSGRRQMPRFGSGICHVIRVVPRHLERPSCFHPCRARPTRGTPTAEPEPDYPSKSFFSNTPGRHAR